LKKQAFGPFMLLGIFVTLVWYAPLIRLWTYILKLNCTKVKGFASEVLIVIAIIGILVSIGLASYSSAAKITRCSKKGDQMQMHGNNIMQIVRMHHILQVVALSMRHIFHKDYQLIQKLVPSILSQHVLPPPIVFAQL
jgi:hypothetical protein